MRRLTVGSAAASLLLLAGAAAPKADPVSDALARARKRLSADDATSAVAILEPLAQRGEVAAERVLGQAYLRKAMNAPYQKELFWVADRWFRAAADRGDPQAQYELAGLLQMDHFQSRWIESPGAKMASQEALLWFERAGTQGHLSSQFRLAQALEIDGTSRTGISCGKAAYWYRRAIASGSNLKDYARRMPEDAGASMFHAEAEYRLGQLYLDGCGVRHDPALGAKWQRSARAHGFIPLPEPFPNGIPEPPQPPPVPQPPQGPH